MSVLFEVYFLEVGMRMDIAAQASKSKPISHPLLGTLKQKEAFKLTSKGGEPGVPERLPQACRAFLLRFLLPQLGDPPVAGGGEVVRVDHQVLLGGLRLS